MRILKKINFKKPKGKVVKKSTVGKKRELKKYVKEIVDKKISDSWPNRGQVILKPKKSSKIVNRYVEVYHEILKKDPIFHLIKNKNKKPKLLILGPGLGQDITHLKQELYNSKINPKIDVLGLQKTIEPKLLEKKIINKDFSSNLSLEDISRDPRKNKRLISKLKGKYDLVVGASSVGLHTLYPAFNVFNTSVMLKKKGVAYIEVPTKKTLRDFTQFGISESQKKRVINQTDNLPKIVTKFLKAYGGEKFSQEFKFSNIDYYQPKDLVSNKKKIDTLHIRYIKIERK